MLLGHRHYDPSTGRFLTRDPIKDGRNWYSYGGGELTPVADADPSGLLIPIFVKAVVLAYKAYMAYETGRGIIENPSDPTNYVPGGKLYLSIARAYRKMKPGKNYDHYNVGPSVDMDPTNHKGGPHVDFPDPLNPGKNLPPEQLLGKPGWDPIRCPVTGRMILYPKRRGKLG
jgi:uncharacterized protein RhaS with RHS repeats